MTAQETAKQFFENVIYKAAQMTGDTFEIMPVIQKLMREYGIEEGTESIEELNRKHQNKELENEKEKAAAGLAALGAAYATADQSKRQELIEGIRRLAASLEPTNGRFQFVRIDSLKVRPPSWLVKGLIETDSFGCLYGDPSTGKSFIGIELSSCIAAGVPFYGLPVKKGPVIYLAGEGQSGLARRFRAWSIARGVSLDGASLYTNQKPISLIDKNSMVGVIQALERLILEIGRPPALAILDTWSRVLGGDDSAPSDAAALDDLRSRFGNFAALIVHHEGHTKGRGRGWSGLRAAVDMELRAELGCDKVLRLECTKSKDTEPIGPMAFHFSTVELGFNDDEGNKVTSAVLTPSGWTPAPEASAKKPVGKNQALAMDVLKQISAGNESVTLDAWREACKETGLDRSQFWYVKTGMEKRGLIHVSDGIVRVGVGLGVGFRGLLYSPPNPSNASNACTPVGNITNPTPSNASNDNDLF
jgi:hypothetical protein